MTYDAMSDFRNVFELPIPGYNIQPNSPMQYSWFRIYILGGIGVLSVLQTFVIDVLMHFLSNMHSSILLRIPSKHASTPQSGHCHYRCGKFLLYLIHHFEVLK